jgi:hypothetical protein
LQLDDYTPKVSSFRTHRPVGQQLDVPEDLVAVSIKGLELGAVLLVALTKQSEQLSRCHAEYIELHITDDLFAL